MRHFLVRVTGTPGVRVAVMPDCDYVFVHGYGEDAQGQYIRGKITLLVANGESALGVQLTMIERTAVGHREPEAEIHGTRECRYMLHQVKDFLINEGACQQSAYARTYEWSFELYVDASQQESFRGCSACSSKYRLEAAAITGAASKDSIAAAPIRIIRCPSVASHDFLNPVTVQGDWGESIKYEVSLGRRAVALGGTVTVEAKLTALEPGVQIITARFYLVESHMVRDKHDTDRSLFHGTRLVSTWNLSRCSGQHPHAWRESLPLSKVVRSCSPSFDTLRVMNSHAMHFAVTKLESSGIESEHSISLPITLFISPELPVSGWDVFVRKKPDGAVGFLDAQSGIAVPPRYDAEHELRSGSPPPPYCSPLNSSSL